MKTDRNQCQIDQLYQDKKQALMRYESLGKEFRHYSGGDNWEYFSVPGRTELCGNHTDHQGGKAIGAAVTLDMAAAARPNGSDTVRIWSQGHEPVEIQMRDTEKRTEEEGTTTALVRGVCDGWKRLGGQQTGFDACIQSEIPEGAGLSSSAAFEMLVGVLLSYFSKSETVDVVSLAQIGQRAEDLYYGKPSGLLDQLCCGMGGTLYLDFGTYPPKVEKIPSPLENSGYELCLIKTGGSHGNLTSEYGAIPKEMREVAAFFQKDKLGEVTEEEFAGKLQEIRTKAGDRALLRGLHFFRENKLVQEQRMNILEHQFSGFLKLEKESGLHSALCLENSFATGSIREQGPALGLALADTWLSDKGLARIHGGGFAGTIQAYVPCFMKEDFQNRMERVFGRKSCIFTDIRSYGPVKIVK